MFVALSVCVVSDENDRAMEPNGPNSRGWGPGGETKPNSIVVDERDTDAWPAITPKVGESPGNGEIKPSSTGSPPSSVNATVSASLPTSNHNAMEMSDSNNAPPTASSASMMNSIWRNSSSGGGAGPSTWEGGITTSPAMMGKTVTTPTSQYQQQQQQGFGGGNSAWDKSATTPATGGNPGATSPNNSGDPSGWLGATAEGPQDASGPKSSAGGMPPGNNPGLDSQPGGKGPASASTTGWLPSSEPGLGFGGGSNPGATNTTNSAGNQPWNNVPSHGFGAAGSNTSSSQQWNKGGNPVAPQGPAGVNGGGWGNQGEFSQTRYLVASLSVPKDASILWKYALMLRSFSIVLIL